MSSADYTQDMRISKEIMKQLSQAYLKIRNTARYMLGNLDGFDPSQAVAPADMLDLDKWAVSAFNDLVKAVRGGYDSYEFHAVYRAIYSFCVVEMSNFYLDIIKDRLYCGGDADRASAQSALYLIVDGMTRMLAPILAFTSQELWTSMPHRAGDDVECVLFNDIPDYDPALALDQKEAERWAELLHVRDVVLKALEEAKEQVKKNQDAEITLHLPEKAFAAWEAGTVLPGFDEAALATLFIVSKVTVVKRDGEPAGADVDATVSVKLSDAPKCPRCWNHDEGIGTPGHHAELCARSAAVLGE